MVPTLSSLVVTGGTDGCDNENWISVTTKLASWLLSASVDGGDIVLTCFNMVTAGLALTRYPGPVSK